MTPANLQAIRDRLAAAQRLGFDTSTMLGTDLVALLDEVERLTASLEAVVAACPRDCTLTSYCGVCEPAFAGLGSKS